MRNARAETSVPAVLAMIETVSPALALSVEAYACTLLITSSSKGNMKSLLPGRSFSVRIVPGTVEVVTLASPGSCPGRIRAPMPRTAAYPEAASRPATTVRRRQYTAGECACPWRGIVAGRGTYPLSCQRSRTDRDATACPERAARMSLGGSTPHPAGFPTTSGSCKPPSRSPSCEQRRAPPPSRSRPTRRLRPGPSSCPSSSDGVSWPRAEPVAV